VLHGALRSSGLYTLQDEGGELTLDSVVSSGGANLSVGQRQILALGRSRCLGIQARTDATQRGLSYAIASC
jgi:ABC-type transport system involved in cytochrome bd biosynthesis fused ATPase/permease subunit